MSQRLFYVYYSNHALTCQANIVRVFLRGKESDILEMQDTLREIKINHSYDTRIGGIPPDWGHKELNTYLEQEIARDCFDTLKALNRLPDDVPWIQDELKRENTV